MWKYLLSMLSLVAYDASAVRCLSGCNQRVENTINQTIGASDNEKGKTFNSRDVNATPLRVIVEPGTMADWAVYRGDSVPSKGSDEQDWKYIKLDDYISIALSINSPCGRSYFPYNKPSLAEGCAIANYDKTQDFYISQRSFQSRIKIDKKIVSGTYVKSFFLAQEGRCQPYGCRTKDVIYYNIYLNLNLYVPQSCELNPGPNVEFDFGQISSGAFNTAGAIAQGVQPKSQSVGVKCSNIDGNAQLTMRVQADKTSGDIVVSDNNDVGFRVTNNSGVPLIPNNLSSVIPFTLDSNARQNVTLQVYPVSVTGNKPKEGKAVAHAYLRVDFP